MNDHFWLQYVVVHGVSLLILSDRVPLLYVTHNKNFYLVRIYNFLFKCFTCITHDGQIILGVCDR